jgi:hypothetical protein
MKEHIPTFINTWNTFWTALYQWRDTFWVALFHWRKLFKLLVKSIFTPLQHPVFVFYFIFFIVGIGGTGIWNEIVKKSPATVSTGSQQIALLLSLATYSLTLSAASLAELYLSKDSQDEPIDQDTRFMYLCFALIPIAGSLITLCKQSIETQSTQIIATLSALLLWWLINANNDRFKSPTNPDAVFGVTKSQAGRPTDNGGLTL